MKNLQILLIAIIIFLNACVSGSKNNQIDVSSISESSISLPSIELADLEGKIYNLPKDFSNDYNIIVFGFAHAQKEATETWIQPLLELKSNANNLTVFKIPVIDNSNLALRTMIRNGMRRGITTSEARQRTLTLFANKSDFIKFLHITDESQPSVILFDRFGKVLLMQAGSYDLSKIDNFKKIILK